MINFCEMTLKNDFQNKGSNNLCKKFQKFLKLSSYKVFLDLEKVVSKKGVYVIWLGLESRVN